MHELGNDPEPGLADLLQRVTPCDLVLIEGFKRERHPKLEVFRRAVGKAPLYPDDPQVLAVATDAPLQGAHPPVVDLNDTEAVAATLLSCAAPLQQVLALLR
jgi:molybdopterin-guanine dinucleotide biosynthesis protein B